MAHADLDNELIEAWNSLTPNPINSAYEIQKYYHFVQNWGTHLISGLTTGSRLKFFSTSKAANRMSLVQYEAKLCAGYKGINVNTSACASITNADMYQASGWVLSMPFLFLRFSCDVGCLTIDFV